MFHGHRPVFRDVARDYTSNQALRRSQEASTDVRHLEERLDRLALVCEAMWALVRTRTDLTEEDLMDMVKQVDLLDGSLDGKAARTVKVCSACGRAMSKKHSRCLYCGAEQLKESAFDEV